MSIQDDDIQDDILGEQFDLSCIEALAPILERIPDMEPPVIKREARYLSGNDIGKTLTVDDHHGIIDELYFNDHSVSVYLRGGTSAPTLSHSTLVTITGKEASK